MNPEINNYPELSPSSTDTLAQRFRQEIEALGSVENIPAKQVLLTNEIPNLYESTLETGIDIAEFPLQKIAENAEELVKANSQIGANILKHKIEIGTILKSA